jgi:hypothetical protein
MSAHRVDVFNFEFWNGSPPTLTYQQGSTFTRAGTNGVGQQRLGRWGDPFDAELTAWYTSYLAAMAALPLMQSMVRTGHVNVIYDGLDYQAALGHRYFVDRVDLVRCQKILRQIGPGINWASGAELVVRFTMTPYYLL